MVASGLRRAAGTPIASAEVTPIPHELCGPDLP